MTFILSILGRFILAPLANLWRWLTADPVRLAFAALLALCAFLGWRLSAVDGDRDDWRDKVKAYESASQIIEDADAAADAEAIDVAHDAQKDIDDGNKRAEDAARGSDDPLRDAFGSLRKEGVGGSDKAPR